MGKLMHGCIKIINIEKIVALLGLNFICIKVHFTYHGPIVTPKDAGSCGSNKGLFALNNTDHNKQVCSQTFPLVFSREFHSADFSIINDGIP